MNYRITGYSELEGTYMDPQVHLLSECPYGDQTHELGASSTVL